MKIREIFHIGDPMQPFDGTIELLDHNNCRIENKKRQEHSILLNVLRDLDGREGNAHLRVRPEFQSVEDQLLGWAINDERMIGLTLNDLEYLDASVEISTFGGKMMFKRKGD